MAISAEMRQTMRDLYAAGRTISEIAKRLGVSRNTVAARKRHDEEAGRPWDIARAEHRSISPLGMLDLLRTRYEAIVRADAEDLGNTQLEQRLTMLLAQIEAWEARLSDPERFLQPIDLFVRWLMAREETMRVSTSRGEAAEREADARLAWLRGCIEGFLEDLKRGKVEATA